MHMLPVSFRPLLFLLAVASASYSAFGQPGTEPPLEFEAAFAERVRSLVAIEYVIQHEIDREARSALGVVYDDSGLVVLLNGSIPEWVPIDRLTDFKAYVPGESSDGYAVSYLGQDYLTGNHHLRIDEGVRDLFSPVTHYEVGRPATGELLWGIGVMGKDWDFMPYFLSARLATIQPMPWDLGFSDTDLASPGSLVFSTSGAFVGWAASPVVREYVMTSGGRQYGVMLQSQRETSMFLLAAPFFERVNRAPMQPTGDPAPWIGVSGMQPVESEVAEFLGLEGQGAVVVSDVIEGSPAALGGLKGSDIIVALNGEPFPKFRPSFVIIRYLESKLLEQKIGEPLSISIVREGERQTLEVSPVEDPKNLREAERTYLDRLGFTAREFTLYDAVNRRILRPEQRGTVAEFVKPNSPVHAAGLQFGDWVQEVDGEPVDDYAEAKKLLEAINQNEEAANVVLLVKRNNETKVLQVKLK